MTEQQIRLLWDEEIDSLILDYSTNLLDHLNALIVENPHADTATIVSQYREHLSAHGINAEFPGLSDTVTEEEPIAWTEDDINADDDELYSLDTSSFETEEAPDEEETVEETSEEAPVEEEEAESTEETFDPSAFDVDYGQADDEAESVEEVEAQPEEEEGEHVETEEERRAREDAEALAAYEAAVNTPRPNRGRNFKEVLAQMTNIDKG